MIGTLTSSPSNIILHYFPAGIFHRGSDISHFFPRKTVMRINIDCGHCWMITKPIPTRSSSINVSQKDTEDAEIDKCKRMVRVRFQLRKECVFGDHIFVLGDDPVFGGRLWDIQYALPLYWSHGHVWTADLELPVGRLVEFKFILKSNTGEILWQPGPNRSLQTWETNKMIRICQDWENADLQMMIEEDFVPISQHENQSSVAKEEEEVLGVVQQQKSSQVVVSDGSDENLSSNGKCEKDIETSNGGVRVENATKENEEEEEGPVLVPGLIPMSDVDDEEVNEPVPYVYVEDINEGKAETFPEVGKKKGRNKKGKVKAVSIFEKAEIPEPKDVEKMHCSETEEEMQQRLETELCETPNVLLEKDIQWGRRKLYKLLSNLGLF
ncbi:unnamed protein product [Cochlearia groenlandica]